jgi:DNA-binding MarR family transcriptional regulator
MHCEEPSDRIQNMRAHLRERLRALTGLEEATGIEISSLVRMIGNQYEALTEPQSKGDGLSGPRWVLLLRLAAEEDNGRPSITPTDLSQSQNVSKNTISALLRGLEEQGLISRELDPDDRRIFRIRITPAGRNLIRDTAPQRVAWMNQLVTQLTPEEQTQLIQLLGKLYCSLVRNHTPLEVP